MVTRFEVRDPQGVPVDPLHATWGGAWAVARDLMGSWHPVEGAPDRNYTVARVNVETPTPGPAIT